MNPLKIIRYPLSTEKTIRLMESENKLIFAVERSATKRDIKTALEKLYKVKVVNINTSIDSNGIKKAYVKLSPETPALDLATELGLM